MKKQETGKWVKVGRETGPEGTTITYALSGTDYLIESRKRHIKHANNRPGTWDHTSYVILNGNDEMAEKMTLKDARKYVEQLL